MQEIEEYDGSVPGVRNDTQRHNPTQTEHTHRNTGYFLDLGENEKEVVESPPTPTL